MSKELEQKDIDKNQIDWNEHAEYWDSFEDAKSYTKQTFRLLSELINLKGLEIVDFGCGTGLLTDYMSKKAKYIVAIDSADKMIEVLNNKHHNNVSTITAELSHKTIAENPTLQQKFDLIVASSVCAFLPNYQEVLGVIKSLLKPGGLFVQWDWAKNPNEPDFGFTEEMIETSYKEVGLELVSLGPGFHFIENEIKMEVIMAVGKLSH